MKLLMTADAVGGVWTYATELARTLAPFGVETTIALLGPAGARPSPSQACGSGPSLSPSGRGDTLPLIPLPGGEREGARSAQPSGKGEGTPPFTVIPTHLPLDWLADGPIPVRAAADAIAALAREIGADIVQLNSPALAVARFDQLVVAVEHGSIAPWWQAAHAAAPPASFAWLAELIRDGLLAADATVAPSVSYAAEVARAYRLPRAPTAVHNGRAPIALPDVPLAAHAFTAGRLWDRVKRTDLLDRVAALTPIRAAGPLTAPHGETVSTRHLDLLGTLPTPALAAHYAARPVFVSAASFEPFGLAVLEAAQAGCPLVLSDIATFRELWDGAALFVAGDDPADWAAAIDAARADHASLGDAARTRAARYTPAATAIAMMAIYAGLLTQTSATTDMKSENPALNPQPSPRACSGVHRGPRSATDGHAPRWMPDQVRHDANGGAPA